MESKSGVLADEMSPNSSEEGGSGSEPVPEGLRNPVRGFWPELGMALKWRQGLGKRVWKEEKLNEAIR